MNIVFVLSHTPDPRMNKRINLLKSRFKTSLVFWNRETVDIWKLVHLDIESKEIRIKATYTNPLKRIIPTLKFAIEAIKYLKQKKPKCIYTGNIDMLVICSFYSFLKNEKPKIIYEVADLNKLIIDEPKGVFKKLLKKSIAFTEKRLCRNVYLLVLTSERFYDIYFRDFFPKEKVLIMPNMPTLKPFSAYRPKTSGMFTVGFIGAVRYKEQMKLLIRVAKTCNVNVLFAGAGHDDEIERLCADMPNIEYYGKYDFDTEIASLYGKCDCIYSVYDADLNNVKVALPNKLYEAIYCSLPIIVAKGTYLAELVDGMGVGVAVSHTDEKDLFVTLNKLSQDKDYHHSFVSNCEKYRGDINASRYDEKLLNRILLWGDEWSNK